MVEGEEEIMLLSAQNQQCGYHEGWKPWDHPESAPWLSSGRAVAAARTHPWLCGPSGPHKRDWSWRVRRGGVLQNDCSGHV